MVDGGLKHTVQSVKTALSDEVFYFRSDIRSFYQSIDHHILMRQLEPLVPCQAIRHLLWGFLRHTITHGGDFADNRKGLPMSSPLSPLLGALYLKPLDEAMQDTGLFYRRYMDDYILCAKKRWPLKRAIRKHYQILEQLGLTTRPEKTEVGRVINGFTFLGYVITSKQLSVSTQTQTLCRKKVRRPIAILVENDTNSS